jgi:hypothetical protein
VIPRKPSLVQIKINGKQQDNMEYFKYFRSIITNDAKRKQEIKSRIAKGRAAFNNFNKNLFTSKLGLILRNKPVKYYTRNIAENWKLRKVYQKY